MLIIFYRTDPNVHIYCPVSVVQECYNYFTLCLSEETEMSLLSEILGKVTSCLEQLYYNRYCIHRGRSYQESQDSDVSTSSTIGSEGSQSLPNEGFSHVEKNPKILPTIPEEVPPINGLSMESDSLSFVRPRSNGYKHSPAGSSKHLQFKSFNDQSPHPPPNHFAAPTDSSSLFSSSRPLLRDRKQWLGWSGGERKQDWELNPDSLTICKMPDGRDWRLGMGGYCEVRLIFSNNVYCYLDSIFRSLRGLC